VLGQRQWAKGKRRRKRRRASGRMVIDRSVREDSVTAAGAIEVRVAKVVRRNTGDRHVERPRALVHKERIHRAKDRRLVSGRQADRDLRAVNHSAGGLMVGAGGAEHRRRTCADIADHSDHHREVSTGPRARRSRSQSSPRK
jgi:hypothetical protein